MQEFETYRSNMFLPLFLQLEFDICILNFVIYIIFLELVFIDKDITYQQSKKLNDKKNITSLIDITDINIVFVVSKYQLNTRLRI